MGTVALTTQRRVPMPPPSAPDEITSAGSAGRQTSTGRSTPSSSRQVHSIDTFSIVPSIFPGWASGAGFGVPKLTWRGDTRAEVLGDGRGTGAQRHIPGSRSGDGGIPREGHGDDRGPKGRGHLQRG